MLVYRFLLVCPVLYIGAISIRARLHLDPFAFTACTKKQHQDILAYREPFLVAAPFRGAKANSVDRVALRKAAMAWVDATREGKLRPLTPVHLDDFVRDGIKQQIFRASDRMSHLLIETGRLEMAAGRSLLATQDIVLALKLSEVLKYSDPYAISQTAVAQRNALALLAKCSERLPAAGKLWVRAELRELRESQRSLEPLVRLMVRLREQQGDGSAVNPKGIQRVASLLNRPQEADRAAVTVLAGLPRPEAAELDSLIDTELVGLLRMSGLSQENWTRQLDAQISRLANASIVENPKGARVASARS